MVSRPWAFKTVVMAALLEQEKRMETLLRDIEGLTRAHTQSSSGDPKRMA